MSVRRGGDRRIVIRCQGCISKAEMRQSILKYLLQEHDIQKHALQGRNAQEQLLQESGAGMEMERGSGSDAGDRK